MASPKLGVPVYNDQDVLYPDDDTDKPTLELPVTNISSKRVLEVPTTTIGDRANLTPPPPATLKLPPTQVASLQGATAGSLPVITPGVYPGGSKPGSIRATPAQGATDYLNLLERQKQIADEGGNNDVETGQLIRGKLDEAGNEKRQQAQDYQNFLAESRQRLEHNTAQAQQAYNEFRKQVAASGRDPSEQFWGDRSMGARIAAGLAGFASGMGAALTGKGGNPFLEHLNQLMTRNFDAHKKHIEDLYNQQVQAGKLVDNAESRNRFEQQAKLNYFELASAHIIPELEGIKANATGQAQRLLADKTIADLMGQGVGLKTQLAHNEAMAQAQYYAMQRQRMKEVREGFQKALELHKDMAPEEARAQAFKDLESSGYNRSDLAPLAAGSGYDYDTGTGRFKVPTSETSGSGGGLEPQLNEKGELILPKYDANGRRLTPQEQLKMQDDVGQRITTDVETGLRRIAVNKDSLRLYTEHAAAYPTLLKLTKTAEDAWKAGDEGRYHQARQAIIELAPQLYGYTRGPSGAQAGERAAEGSVYGATVAGQLPEHISLSTRVAPATSRGLGTSTETARKLSNVGVGDSLLAGWKQTLNDVHESMQNNTFGGGGGTNGALQPDPFASVGGKAR